MRESSQPLKNGIPAFAAIGILQTGLQPFQNLIQHRAGIKDCHRATRLIGNQIERAVTATELAT
jgi:hypothetical protein